MPGHTYAQRRSGLQTERTALLADLRVMGLQIRNAASPTLILQHVEAWMGHYCILALAFAIQCPGFLWLDTAY